ncbi:serine/threonine protein kinase [Dehalococcoidia bacterium]|nr:serine/threonine protein kinase [Dehalococcoidia bacterium]
MSQQPDKIGKYDIVRKVGQGGQGIVYEARDPDLGRQLALKVMLNVNSGSSSPGGDIFREAFILAQLNHPNITTIFELIDTEDGHPCAVMEFLPSNLTKSIFERVDQKESIRFMRQICEAMEFAHSNDIIHRDLKPANIMIDHLNNAKIVDFGLAKIIGDQTIVGEGFFAGTPLYSAPEQVRGEIPDNRADIYSAGIIFYELIIGNSPFKDQDSQSVMNMKRDKVKTPELPSSLGISSQLRSVVNKATSVNPDDRYDSFSDMLADIDLIPGNTAESTPDNKENKNEENSEEKLSVVIRRVVTERQPLSKAQLIWAAIGITMTIAALIMLPMEIGSYMEFIDKIRGKDVAEVEAPAVATVVTSRSAETSVKSVPAITPTVAVATPTIVKTTQSYELMSTPVPFDPTAPKRTVMAGQIKADLIPSSNTTLVSEGGEIIIDIPGDSISQGYKATLREVPENLVQKFPPNFVKIHEIIDISLEGSGLYSAKSFRFEESIRINIGVLEDSKTAKTTRTVITHLEGQDWIELDTLRYSGESIMFAETKKIGLFAIVEVE